ncbi:GntP family permease [Bartonella sp. HY761]|uniref:GntP family permease n=1 Tax=Bartonella sp. HY761 TaxID=2979330 RepID=UPI0021FB7B6A|nr:GntP family permease [Bartonella sp. HY761]UXN07632.1 GntP family permease [Bartonella sp. HY761]
MLKDFVQTLGAPELLLITAIAILVLLVLIIKLKIHAFLALIIVSIATAFATQIPSNRIVEVLTSSFGATVGGVALLVGLGAMLGRMVEGSGGAHALAESLISRFGEQRAPLALGVASLLFGFPIFFDAGLIVMLPIVFSVAKRLGGGILRYAIPAAGAFSVMHVFVPPHPGPVAAASFLHADIGILTIIGIIIAIPTWYVTSYLFGLFVGKRYVFPVPDLLSGGKEIEYKNPPSAATIVVVLLIPLVIIFMNTGLTTLKSAGVIEGTGYWFGVLTTIGSTPVALLIAVLFASYKLGYLRGLSGVDIEKMLGSALGPVCGVILITGAGGMFGGVLRASGIGDALAGSLSSIGLPVFVAGFVVAAILRIAQGSATVALTTAASLIETAVLNSGYNSFQIIATVIAVAAGSVVCSHVNDSGFWLVSRFLEIDEKTTFKTWTVMETTIGIMAFLLAGMLFLVASIF